MSRPLLCLLLSGWSGCISAPDEIDERDLAKRMGQVLCARIRDCDRAFYDATYFGKSDCRDSQERAVEDTADAASDIGCDYSAADAGDAWQDIEDMPCEDFVDGEAEAAVFDIWGDCF